MDYCITKTDIDQDGYYIGPSIDGQLHASPDLGRIKFRQSLKIDGDLVFGERTGLQVDGNISVSGLLSVGCGIIAIEDISAGGGIWAGAGLQSLNGSIASVSAIHAGRSIIAGGQLSAIGSIDAGENIFAGRSIRAGLHLTAGRGISANEEIVAGGKLEAVRGITAGFSIDADIISCNLRIMAGLCRFRLPQPEETEVRFRLFEKGDVAFGRAVQKNLSA